MLRWLDAEGLADNTVVIYIAPTRASIWASTAGSTSAGCTRSRYRTPLLVRWPGVVKPGVEDHDLVCNVDFAPTFLDYRRAADLRATCRAALCVPCSEGSTPSDWDQLAYHRYWMHNDVIHEALGALWRPRPAVEIDLLVQRRPRPAGRAAERRQSLEWELFDCEQDPFELTNRAGDPACDEIFATMLAKLDAKMDAIGDLREHDSAAVLASRQRRAASDQHGFPLTRRPLRRRRTRGTRCSTFRCRPRCHAVRPMR